MSKMFFLKTVLSLAFFSTYFPNLSPVAEWSLLIYMQGDNSLSGCINPDIEEILKAHRMVTGIPLMVNTLVQVDYPQDQKTWRFKIDRYGKLDDASLNEEMGISPVDELVASAKWVKSKYPANHYALILWSHGSGIEDYRNSYLKLLNAKNFKHELNNNKLENNFDKSRRGILYDDSQGTCLRNEDLTSALSQIKEVFGRKIDIVGMDACLMAMVEIAYQIKDYANILVGSQQIEPGTGWIFDRFLIPLISDPYSFNAEILAKLIVKTYGDFYIASGTQSAIYLDSLDLLYGNIDAVAKTILECLNYRSPAVIGALKYARSNSLEFDNKKYIDLFCFYRQLNAKIPALRTEAENSTQSCCFVKPSQKYFMALDLLHQHLSAGMLIISDVVFANAANGNMKDAHGISIYYPISRYKIHPSYPKTMFAQQVPSWLELLKKFV
ncbi:MAG: Clostripain family protease [candidate division TM6 bacterium GW2011_GWF2_36_6]|jgi:hypothetical protein|nr:MAG: Clostripain family protease [candidate division TM6 bacterium GW2011_GWF2_36_6]